MKNSNRHNLIISLLSLVVTTFLLVFTVYSWYTSNQEVETKSIIGATEIQKTSFELEAWKNDEWKKVSKIEEKNVLPGKTTYFRLKCVNDNDTTIRLTAKFEGIQSKLDTTYVKVSTDKTKITYNGIETYSIASNQVTVEPVVENGETKSILYDVDNTTISLRHFKIQESYIIQRFGTTETKTGAVTKRDDLTNSLDTISISDSILNKQEIAIGTSYYYFALTFLDNDDIDKYLMYQGLYISSLTMFED